MVLDWPPEPIFAAGGHGIAIVSVVNLFAIGRRSVGVWRCVGRVVRSLFVVSGGGLSLASWPAALGWPGQGYRIWRSPWLSSMPSVFSCSVHRHIRVGVAVDVLQTSRAWLPLLYGVQPLLR